jgi:hypothetical protein
MFGMILMLMGIFQAAAGMMIYTSVGLEMLVFGILTLLGGYYLQNMERFTPAKEFLTARRKKEDILEVERKDGSLAFDVPEYMAGSAISERYGIFTVNPEDIKTERKSGVKVLHVTEGIGTTIDTNTKHIIKYAKEQYGIKSYQELIDLANHWHICKNEKCRFLGYFEEKNKEIIHPETKEVLGQEVVYKCPKCQSEGEQFEPELLQSNGENVESGWIDRYFKQVQHPMLKRVIVKNMAANIAEKEKKEIPIAKIAILLSFGMMFFLVAIGLMVLLPQLEAYSAGQIAKNAAEPVIQRVIPG